ncbi:hypothetical protein JOF36_006433 [Pseudonocardia parietis]|uniref:Uncharacterized protein n=1 Tax=Pseudonocardia parietis TaxID=570936 RepID=A0ABS4W3F2_9PSEU|nr:hypothetical protein [Pseudonocardia parietis]
MNSIVMIDRIGPAVVCASAEPVAAVAAIPASRKPGVRRRGAEQLLVAAPTPRTRGDVYPAGPIFDEHKCTGASVPGRRGGT